MTNLDDTLDTLEEKDRLFQLECDSNYSFISFMSLRSLRDLFAQLQSSEDELLSKLNSIPVFDQIRRIDVARQVIAYNYNQIQHFRIVQEILSRCQTEELKKLAKDSEMKAFEIKKSFLSEIQNYKKKEEEYQNVINRHIEGPSSNQATITQNNRNLMSYKCSNYGIQISAEVYKKNYESQQREKQQYKRRKQRQNEFSYEKMFQRINSQNPENKQMVRQVANYDFQGTIKTEKSPKNN